MQILAPTVLTLALLGQAQPIIAQGVKSSSVPRASGAPVTNLDKALTEVMEALEAIPESLSDRKPAQGPKAKDEALKVWNLHRATLEGALKPVERDEVIAALGRMKASAGVQSAEAALDASEVLAKLAAPGRSARLGRVDRHCQRAWLRVEEERWSDLPDLSAAFEPFLDSDGKTHPKTVGETRRLLASWAKALTGRDKVRAQQAVEHLLECVDGFETPEKP